MTEQTGMTALLNKASKLGAKGLEVIGVVPPQGGAETEYQLIVRKMSEIGATERSN